MKIHLIEKFGQFPSTFLAFGQWVIAYLLQYLLHFFAFLTLVFINGHIIASQPSLD